METLRRYIDEVGASALATKIGCSRQLVSHWRTGRQEPSPRMARIIESISDGAVLAADIRPDVFGPLPERAA
jgi:DNA-binding transcriptional regulator YdaS (Cro superfamily)